MKRMILCAVAILCVCMVAAVGCNKGPKKVHVTGTVTVNGETVHQGSVTFTGTDEAGMAEGAAIKDGKFEADLTTGEKKVTAYGSKKTGNKIKPDPTLNPDLEVDEVEDIPAKFFQKEVTVNIEKNGQVVEIVYETE